ncbi:DNA alkylation repair protein [Prolixibacteraceae bacterium Z1-6]|uniref:DNA alkylation repair protein n=1 Tax=Draconibacterium aestuarii TaxID=2998507 RepID=A0A9X3J5V3_9BACT|nr:DNA alkylation repair protein [Prolixibacteraceae bacterium Z1-6]
MIDQTIAALKFLAEEDRKERSKIMFPTSMRVFGVRAENIKKVVNECWNEFKNRSPEELLLFSKKLVKAKILEASQVAFLLLWKNKKALRLIALEDIEELGQNMDNWVTVDTLSVMISGWAWRENQISDDDVLNWLKSENRWWRRTAVVSTVPLNLRSRGGTGDAKRTLLICEKVVSDRDDMIVKALSWALRELSKSDKSAVEQFMAKYDTQLAGRVRREVYTKLETGRKNG